ncbi:hypothetical protein GF324_01190 [bacterium]|nr:hypothetical protein [bacterium]
MIFFERSSEHGERRRTILLKGGFMKGKVVLLVGVVLLFTVSIGQWAVADIFLSDSVPCGNMVENHPTTVNSPADAKSVIDNRDLEGDSTDFYSICAVWVSGTNIFWQEAEGYVEDTYTHSNVPWDTRNSQENMVRWDVGGSCTGGRADFILESPY